MRIGKRNLSTFLKRISSLENYKAITKFRKVHINPLKSFYQEIFSTGTYPQKIKFKTPTGQHEIEIYSPADFSTFNLIFCRQDYYFPKNFNSVIDIGSNIGLSSIYWLTRNSHCKVYCYEPSTVNFYRLKKNLESFKNRCTLNNLAVSNYNGSGDLHLEKYGVYSSLKIRDKEKEYLNKEKCQIVHINQCLEEVLKNNDEVDILKIDNEGEEVKTVSSINKSFWKFIKCINVDGNNVREYIPSNFKLSVVGSAQRFFRN